MHPHVGQLFSGSFVFFLTDQSRPILQRFFETCLRHFGILESETDKNMDVSQKVTKKKEISQKATHTNNNKLDIACIVRVRGWCPRIHIRVYAHICMGAHIYTYSRRYIDVIQGIRMPRNVIHGIRISRNVIHGICEIVRYVRGPCT